MLRKIIAWGDSVLKGIVYDDVKKKYLPLRDEACLSLAACDLGLELENRAKFGMTSEKGLPLVERALSGEPPLAADAVLLGFGGNDIDYDWRAISLTPDETHLPNTPPERFEANITAMVRDVRKAGLRPILVNLPRLDAQRYFDWISRGLNGENIRRWLGTVEVIERCHSSYNAIIDASARRLDCLLVDVRSVFRAFNPDECLCVDGIHPNALGHRRMGEAYEAVLSTL